MNGCPRCEATTVTVLATVGSRKTFECPRCDYLWDELRGPVRTIQVGESA